MSVQAGIWNFDRGPINPEWLNNVSCSLAEYGPDGENLHISGSIAMLYRPFHTTAESRLEHQPSTARDGIVIMFDGRLDNREELVAQLAETPIADRTDIAIVVAAYEHWGKKFLSMLIGDWALSIWNPLENELLLARDYIGVRQLFYRVDTKSVSWCNHLAPLVQLGARSSLSDKYIAGYLARCPLADLTPYDEIRSVPPAQLVSIRDYAVSLEPYWVFDARRKTRYNTAAEYEDQFLHLLRQAVRRRLHSPTPILAELSGGLDSSSVVCVADDILRTDESHPPALDTFSYSFPDEPDADDHLYFTKVEARRGRRGHRAEVRGIGDSFSLDYASFLAVPGFGGRQEVQTARSAVIKDGKYRVLLSGLGGDEFVGQSLDPRVQMADMLRLLQMKSFVRNLKEWSLLFRRPWIQVLCETVALLMPTSMRLLLGKTEDQSWIDERFARRHQLSALRLLASKGLWSWPPSARDWYETHSTLSSFLTNLRPSCIEARYPYLDQNLVEFLISIPLDQLLRPGDRRSLMRRALADVLPSDILSRRTKQSEGRCYITTLAKHWDRLKGILASPVSSALGYTNRLHFKTVLEAYKNGQPSRYPALLLRALSLEIWLRDMIARDLIAVPHHAKPVFAADSLRSPRVGDICA